MKKTLLVSLAFLTVVINLYASSVCMIKGNVKYLYEPSARRAYPNEASINCIGVSDTATQATERVLTECKTKYYKDLSKGIATALASGELTIECDNEFNQRPAKINTFTSEQLQTIKNNYMGFEIKKSCMIEHTDAKIVISKHKVQPDPSLGHEALILESDNTIQIIVHQNSEQIKVLAPLKKAKFTLISEEKLKKKTYRNSYDPANTLRYYYRETSGVLLRDKTFTYEVNEKAHLVRYFYGRTNGLGSIVTDTDWKADNFTLSNCN